MSDGVIIIFFWEAMVDLPPATDVTDEPKPYRHILPWRRYTLVTITVVALVIVIVVPVTVVTRKSEASVAQELPFTTTTAPTLSPTLSPSTSSPTQSPTTLAPSKIPSSAPSSSEPTPRPTTPQPTSRPTARPSADPTQSPTTQTPTLIPTSSPTVFDVTRFPQTAVDRLQIGQFKSNIESLSNFGDRLQGSPSYNNAAAWVRSRLEAYGYSVQEHPFLYRGQSRTNLYVTKVGRRNPEQMYIISAHLDGRGNGGAANDDGSGCSLVLEIARVLAMADIATDISVRMIFWNCEETGLNGAYAYVRDRKSLQGREQPPGSNLYPEPQWLGMITHDQILFDHGLPVQAQQSPNADADIEFQTNSAWAGQSRALANTLASSRYAKDYPAEVSGDMCCTDSVPFQDDCPAVSIRENRRRAEIGQGSQPNWHQPTDLYTTYSELDFLFGFNIVQTTMGTIGQLTRLTVIT